MDELTLDLDALDPIVYNTGRFAGLLKRNGGNQIGFQTDWFEHPYQNYLRDSLADGEQREAFLELMASLLGSSSPQVLGLPADIGGDGQWYPISNSGLYLVTKEEGAWLHFGLGLRWDQTDGGLQVRTWAHLPLIRTNGTAVQRDGSEVQVALEVTHSNRFGTDELSFLGIKAGAQLPLGGSGQPTISFQFLQMQLPDGGPPMDRSLVDLASRARPRF